MTENKKVEAASLIVAPALMSIGDLMHPHESWDARAQVAMVAAAATRWYLAHLLLLVGMLLFVPGILLLSRTVARRRPAIGYAGRVLVLASVGALSAVFAFEMVLGAFAAGGDQGAAVALLETFNSRVLVVLLPGLLAFFVGTGLFVAPLAATAGPLRWPALCLALGALLILGEIITAQVVLSQIGNVLILVAGVGFARVLGREQPASVSALTVALIGLLPFSLLACAPADSIRTIDVALQKGELYQYPTVSGDEEGARISTQAGHYAISEIRRDSATNWVAVYVYQPAAGFVGSDQVELQLLSYSDGASPPIVKSVAIHFAVRE